jgi:hypothetical protein
VTPEVAALFVQARSVYKRDPRIDAWDEKRDARLYDGDLPVIAHPPCASWCQLAGLRQARYGYLKGEDGGCFASALASVRRVGGVLEHPAWTAAWAAHDLNPPPAFGWARSLSGEWVCEVAQSAYGHRAQKLTWLLYVGAEPPAPLNWARPKGAGVVSGARNNSGRPLSERVWSAEASRTPLAFKEALFSLAVHSRARVVVT